MPLNDIIYRTGIKRKALAVVPTQCNFCFRVFLDKYYNEPVHKVVCSFCGKLNAKVQIDDIMEVILMGLRRDIGMRGNYGYHMTSFKKIKKIFQKVYGDQADMKIQQLLNNLDLSEKAFKEWTKQRKKKQKIL